MSEFKQWVFYANQDLAFFFYKGKPYAHHIVGMSGDIKKSGPKSTKPTRPAPSLAFNRVIRLAISAGCIADKYKSPCVAEGKAY